MDLDVAVAHGLDRGRREPLHAHPPLFHHERLIHRPAALVHAHRMRDRLLLHEEALVPEELHHHLTRGLAVRAGERSGGGRHHPALVDDREHRETVALTDLEVGRIVAWGDLERTCAECRIDGAVGDDLHAPLHPRHEDVLADHRLPPGVVGMDGHRDVRDDRLGARRRNDHVRRAGRHPVRPRIAHVVERVCALDVLDLEVGIGRLAFRTPVDDAVRAIEMLVLVEADEVCSHRALLRRLHREVRP